MTGRLVAALRRRRRFVLAGFVKASPELLAAAGAGFVAWKIVDAVSTMDKVNGVLRVIIFVLAAVWWSLRFYEHYSWAKSDEPPS